MPRMMILAMAAWMIASLLLLLCATACSTQHAAKASAQAPKYEQKTAHDGGQIFYDPAGSFYHYRCADGIAMLTLWVPPTPANTPVRGLFVNGNPGGISGDNRQFTRDATFRAYGARLNFGLMGLHSMPGGQVRAKYAATILNVLKDFAAMGHHPELANVPLITLGNSNGASTSWAITNVAPERMVCFAMNVGGMPGDPVPAAYEIPGFIVIGPKDNLMGRRPEYLPQYREAIAKARARGARWTYLEEENKGHEVGHIFDYQMVFFEHCINARLPGLNEPGGDPRVGPVVLKPMPVESGWLADNSKWASGLTPIAPYAQYEGDRSATSWIPDEDLAYLYRGLSTYSSPVKLRIANLGEIINTNASGRFLTEVGGHLVSSDTQLVLEADVSAFPGWTKIEFYRASRKLGELNSAQASLTAAQAHGDKVRFTTTPGNDAAAQSYTALAYQGDTTVRPAIPAHVVVRQPSIDVTLPPQTVTPRPQAARPVLGSSANGAPATQPAADPKTLVAYALTAQQEAQFLPSDGAVSPFWEQIPVGTQLTVQNAAVNAAQFSSADDVQLLVKAAHTRAGLYLYFEATDDQFAPALANEHMVGQDSVDFLIDNRSIDEIWKDPSTSFVNAGWSLSMTTRQFQVPFGADTAPTHVRDSWVEPFEWRASIFPRSELLRARGIVVKWAKLSDTRKVQEWFLPWPEVGAGGGLSSEPAVGTTLAFTVGYNDQDPAKGPDSRQLRWNKLSPWQLAPYREGKWTPNNHWGQLLIGPAQ